MTAPDPAGVRRVGRWFALVSALDDAMPIYPVYALLFADSGIGDGAIAGLFALWSVAVVVLEVPSGAWGDVVARHRLLAVAGVVRAAGFALWVVVPSYPAFLAGFLLWALGSSMISGTLEAHVHDSLAVHGAQDAYRAVSSRAHVAALVAMTVTTASAPLLLDAGGYLLAGLVSSAVCLAFTVAATRLPDPAASGWRRVRDAGEGPDGAAGLPAWTAWWRMLRTGLAEATRRRPVRRAVLLATVVWAALALDEFFPLLARSTGFSVAAVPLVMVVVAAAQSVGAWAAGRPGTDRRLPWVCLLAGALLVAGCLAASVPAWAAIAVGYGLGQTAVVVAGARIQAVVSGDARATVTSVASLGSEVLSVALYLSWGLAAGPLGRPVATAFVAVTLLLAVPLALAGRRAADLKPARGPAGGTDGC